MKKQAIPTTIRLPVRMQGRAADEFAYVHF